MKRRERRRSGLLIYPKLQIKLLAVQAGIMALLYAVTLFRIDLLQSELIETLRHSSFHPPETDLNALQESYDSTRSVLGFAFVAVTFVLFCVSLWLSHRVAGPVRRLQNYFARICQNPEEPLQKLTFRKGDFFEDLPPLIESAISKLLTKSQKHSSRKIDDPPDPRDRAA